MIENVLNPGILFFILGVFAAYIKSDLKVSEPIVGFITLYLMIAIGFSGGINLYRSELTEQAIWAVFSVLLVSVLVPSYTMLIMSNYISRPDAAALGGTYGSNSTLTYITAAAFLSASNIPYSGFMTVALVLMELPAIIVSLVLLTNSWKNARSVLTNSLRDGTLVLLLGSMVIAFILVSVQDDEKMLSRFLTGDVFIGFLLFFLLYMGLKVGSEIKTNGFKAMPLALIVFAVVAPIFNAMMGFGLAWLFNLSTADGFLLMILCCSSSYIVAPAIYNKIRPDASPSMYLTPSITITFPINIILGIPMYWKLAQFI